MCTLNVRKTFYFISIPLYPALQSYIFYARWLHRAVDLAQINVKVFLACSDTLGGLARFRTATRSTEGGKSTIWSGERPPKWVARKWRRRRAVTVPEVASLQARAPARREWGSEFTSLCPTEHTYIHTFFSVRWLHRAEGPAQVNVEGFL